MDIRPQTQGEEIANSVIHGLALLGSLAAVPVLLITTGSHDAWQMVGVAVFGASLVLLYGASTLYHAVSAESAKRVLRMVDHVAIYLLIAGSYTPFMLGVLRGPVGFSLLAAIWGLAVFGIVAKLRLRFRYPHLSTALYLLMGWMIVLAIRPLLTHVSTTGLLWLLAGGLCYTGGVAFYVTDTRVRYGHAIWHVFVAAGSACHFFAILWHSAPAS